MAYAAAVYLLQLLRQLEAGDDDPKQLVHHLQGKIRAFKDFLEKNSSLEDNSESTNHLESRIRDAIYKAEDIIERHMSAQFLSSGSGQENLVPIFCQELQRVALDIDSIAEETKKVREKNDLSIFCEDLQRVIQDLDSIGKRAKKFREHMSILSEDLQRMIQDIDSIADRTGNFTVRVGRDLVPASMLPNHDQSRRGVNLIVGRNTDIEKLADRLRGVKMVRIEKKPEPKVGAEIGQIEVTYEARVGAELDNEVIPIVGISGIGKTALAQAVYTDPLIIDHFECRAWIKVSREYHKRDILLGILRSMGLLGGGQRQETDGQLAKHLYDSLKSKRYLVVLDDICDAEAWNYLKQLLPDNDNGSRIVITTRATNIARLAKNNGKNYHVRKLKEEESWDLLRRIVFPDQICLELEQIAKNVARKCRGLPRAIVLIGRVLAKAGIRGWQTAASSISFSENYDELIDVGLSLTYRSLPQHFKACLLYMGNFPRSYEIPVSKLIKLWIAEGFLELDGFQFQTLEKMAKELLVQLVGRNLVSACEQSSSGSIKTCMIDDAFREFIKKKAEEEKFFHVINKDTKGFLEGADDQRRLCILKNIRFGIKDMADYNSKASVSTARSLLYSGPEHPNPLRGWLDFKLLRVLDALSISFYSFPLQILKLVRLRYLAFSCNGELPASVSKLRNLQFLIVLRKLSTKQSGYLLLLPVEIWNMKELRHLQFMGRDLPDGKNDDGKDGLPLLENLLTLSDVTSHSCTEGVLKRVPNLKKLGIRIESPAHDGAENFSFLSNLHILHHLESLKCVVVRPDFGSQVVSSVVTFPPTLRKLCLSGCGFPWDYMKAIAALPKLEVLKLQNYCFRGPAWHLDEEEEFVRLKFLLLEDMDVENWVADSTNFPVLQRLIIRHCYKLQEIPSDFGDITTLELIELDDCNPSAVESVLRILEEQRDLGIEDLQVRIPFSWNNHKFSTFPR